MANVNCAEADHIFSSSGAETSPPTPTFLYFAYGSNMSTARLRARTPSCKPMGQANLTGHQLRFHKKSKDGSAKCDAFRTGDEGDIVCGVLFEIAQNEKTQLDRAEGLGKGYDYQVIEVQRADGSVCEAHAYVASPAYVDTSLNPTAAYMQFVLDGAREHRLPSGYVEKFISTVPTTGGHEL